MIHPLGLTIPDQYAGPLIVAAIVGLAGLIGKLTQLLLRLVAAVADLEGRVDKIEQSA